MKGKLMLSAVIKLQDVATVFLLIKRTAVCLYSTKSTVVALNQGRLLETVWLRCATCIALQNSPSKNMVKSHLTLDSMIFGQRLEKEVHAESNDIWEFGS